MIIYDALKKDHEKVKGLLDRLVKCSESDNSQWKSLVDQIRDELIPHARSEEAVFYNSIRVVDPGNEGVRHSYTEHAMAESDLRALQAMKMIDVNWTKLAKKLRDDINHHISEEESRVFNDARKLFSQEECEMMGKAFARMKPDVKEQGLMGTTIDLIANLLPPRLTAGFRKHYEEDKKKSA